MMNEEVIPGGDGRAGEKVGRGKGYYVIGLGPDRTTGDVEVTLRTVSPPGHVAVEWNVEDDRIPDDIRRQILSSAAGNLHWYLETHPEYGLGMTIEKVSADDTARSNFERAIVLSLYFALDDASLPVPQIFE